MAKLKLHAKRELSYDPQTSGIVRTKCWKAVDTSQIAAFEEGVTCKSCLANIQWQKDSEADWAARREHERKLHLPEVER